MGWVEDRNRCTLRFAFDAIKDFVKRDVKEANALLEKGHDRFTLDNGNGGIVKRFYVRGYPINTTHFGNEKTVTFELLSNKIQVTLFDDKSTLSITHKWDFKSSSCFLFLNEKKVSAEEISQLSLETLLFE